MKCPSCQSKIEHKNINIATDLATCDVCKNIFKLSEIFSNTKAFFADSSPPPVVDFDINVPPEGAWFKEKGTSLELGVAIRSYIGLMFVPFVFMFVFVSIFMTLFISSMFGFGFLILMPLMLTGLLPMGLMLLMLKGKVIITLDGNKGRIFTGVGKIGRTQNFLVDKISTIKEKSLIGKRGRKSYFISMEGQARINFGYFLSDTKRYYITKSLQKLIMK